MTRRLKELAKLIPDRYSDADDGIGRSWPGLIDSKSAARYLCMSTRRLWSLTNRSAIPCHRIGRSVRYEARELMAWVAADCPTEAGAGDRLRKGGRA